MHIIVNIEASENGYSYTGMPRGEQKIDLEISETIAEKIDLSAMVKCAIEIAVSDYKKLAETFKPED